SKRWKAASETGKLLNPASYIKIPDLLSAAAVPERCRRYPDLRPDRWARCWRGAPWLPGASRPSSSAFPAWRVPCGVSVARDVIDWPYNASKISYFRQITKWSLVVGH